MTQIEHLPIFLWKIFGYLLKECRTTEESQYIHYVLQSRDARNLAIRAI